MEEMEMITEENLETVPQETETTTQETQEAETQETETQSQLSSDPVDYSEGMYDLRDNVIHELFYSLGVDLDYVPKNNFQCFTMALSFLAALWFIWHFVKFLWRLMIQSFSVGR